MKTISKIITLFILLIVFACSKEDDIPPPVQNQAPVMNDQSYTVAENITDNLAIGTIEASDPDNDTLSFSITANDNDLFEISETGELSLAVGQSLDFETAESHGITVQVTDGSSTAMAVIEITVTDIDENTAPVISAQNFTAAEDIADNLPIGTVEASDPDDDTLSFSITANDNDLFEISETGELSLAAGQSLDFETAESHSITVQVTDGSSTAMAVIEITVTDNVENSPPVINTQTFTVLENIADNMPIGTVEASDPDNDALSFIISSNDNNLFEISNTGVLSLDDLKELNFDIAQSHTLTIAVNDGTSTSEAEITINVTELDPSAFITTWQTTSNNEIVTIPTRAADLFYSYSIDWGDGTQNSSTADASHSYAQPGTYTVIIKGRFPAIVLGAGIDTAAQRQFRSIEQWGDIEWRTMANAFFRARNFTINATDTPNLSRVTSMESMFRDTQFNQDISGWDVSNVTNMTSMFSTSSFNQDIGGWDVSNVTTMEFMFNQSQFNQDIGGWNVSSVINMQAMFQLASFNQDISGWIVSNVTDMGFMFNQSQFNQDISGWNVSSVTDMENMFLATKFNQNIGRWDVSNVRRMAGMFKNTAFNQDISGWNVSSVTNMQAMFEGSVFNQTIKPWDVSRVTTMEGMFRNSQFNQFINTWDVTNVTNCNEFSLNAPLTEDNTPNFTNCNPK